MEYIDDRKLLENLDTSKHLPATYKIGRNAIIQLAKVDPNLFTHIEEKESGNYIVRGIERKVNDYDFNAFSFAIAKILYNQSYQSGNDDINTGLKRTKATTLSNTSSTNKEYFSGSVAVSLNDLCREAYGGDITTEKRRNMEVLLNALHNNKVHIDFPNGDAYDAVLCATMGKYIRRTDKAIFYELQLHPIFSEAVSNNFALFPQETIQRLAQIAPRQTAAHLRLLKLLGMQDKRKPFTRYIGELADDMGLADNLKKDRGRTEKQIIATIENIKELGMIDTYATTKTTIRKAERIEKITFTLNKHFCKEDGGQ